MVLPHILYLFVLSNSYLIEVLCTKKRKKDDTHTTAHLLTTDLLRGYLSMIEDMLAFYFWLKKGKYLKSDFEICDDNLDSRVISQTKCYLQLFKNSVVRKGNTYDTY